MAACEEVAPELGARRVTSDDGIGRVSLVGAGMKSHPGVTATDVPDARRRRDQHRDDLDVVDPHLVRDPCRPRRGRGAPAPRRVRAGRRRRRLRGMDVGVVGATGRPARRWSRSWRSARSRSIGSASSPRRARRVARSRSAARTLVVEDAATADFAGLDLVLMAAGKATSLELAPQDRRGRRDRRRQLVGVARGPRRPARRRRGERPRARLDPEGDRREPQLHDDGGDAGAQAARTTRRGSRRSSSRPTRRSRARGATASPSSPGSSRGPRRARRCLATDGAAVDHGGHESSRRPSPTTSSRSPARSSTTAPSRPTRSTSTATSRARSSGSRGCASPARACGSRSSPGTARRSPRRSAGRLVAEEATELLRDAPGVALRDVPTPLEAAGHGPEPRRAAPRAPTPSSTACRSSSSATTCARARRSTPCRSPRPSPRPDGQSTSERPGWRFARLTAWSPKRS